VKIYLVRHGQSEWQVGTTQSLDSRLTKIGHMQSRCVSDWFACEKPIGKKVYTDISALWISPLIRAQETAFYVKRKLGLVPVIKPSLCEAQFRVGDHLERSEIPLAGNKKYHPPKVYLDFKSQVELALADLLSVTSNRVVLVITHGAMIETMLRLIVGCDRVRFPHYNAGFTQLEWDDGLWHFKKINFCEHLPEVLRTE